MNQAEILPKSAGPAGTDYQGEQIRVLGSAVIVRWSSFMLEASRPAEELEDLRDAEAARRAEREASARGETPIPWEQGRETLGL